MPKDKSSEGKRRKLRRKATPANLKGLVPAQGTWWRQSTIRKNKKISRTLALKQYKLEPSDLDELPFSESPVAITSPEGNLNLRVSLYNERMVERVAWIKYGGPEAFESYLESLRDEYIQTYPLGAWEFQYPATYSKTGSVDLEDHSPSPVSNTDATPNRSPQHGLDARPSFSHQPLGPTETELHEAHASNINSPSSPATVDLKVHRPIPIPVERWDGVRAEVHQSIPAPMQTLQREFQSHNYKWLWDAAIREFAFPSDIPTWSHLTPTAKEKALRELLRIARTYPPRPTPPSPASPTYTRLHDVLQRAPSLTHRRLGDFVLHEFFGGRRWLWTAEYMSDLFAALIAIINEHGSGEEGWMSARWEVYDTFSNNLQGLSFRDDRWYDGASDWLKGRMDLPPEHVMTTRQDNRSDLGRCYNSMLPEQ
ncbi:hypothetical protein B0H17DRAFT_1144442 [Mycena rosella]|uniref:Uncharacterized protein n=1 Tax=Mycena rosella TaxID=1033263 RepID=A0AAD7G3D3_MYCRO|nr:hypothetical protein B0H17DRAFT_1144442 [Mycena rosella]